MKALILGRGLLGREIERQTGWRCLPHDEFDVMKFPYKNDHLPMEIKEDVIINCTGYTKTYDNNKKESYLLNYVAVLGLVGYCKDENKKLVHISTDYLYAGSVPYASETDLPVPVATWYGYYKLLADEYISQWSRHYLICRGTHKQKPFQHELGWRNQKGNFDYVDVIAGLIIKLIEKNAVGLYNVGTEEKTMLELARRTRHVKGCHCPDGVPKDVTMNLDKLNSFLS